MDSHISKYFDNTKSLTIVFGWAALFLTTIWAYWPGLHGPFLLDDFGSLAALGDHGGVKDWTTFKAFVFGGHSGPTGRPLSLLTFLIDATNWPADSFPFKRTNLVIHLLNGALLGVLISKILNLLDFEVRRSRWIALFSTACWLLHPFLISTTLYAVQRMAQLSTLFIFAGLIGHLSARAMLPRNAIKAYVMMTVSIGLFTTLAMISKENGILLPLLIGVLEFTILASQQARFATLDRRWMAVFVLLPSIIIFAYIGQKAMRPDFFEINPLRDFSIYERALTQPRILFDYLQHWFIPSLYTTGIFQDHFIKSTGLFSPLTTVISAVLHVAIISLAILTRRNSPLFAFAVLFFYASHILESSLLNLELYFEHRNYISVAFLVLPLVVFLAKKISREFLFFLAIGVPLLLAGFTRYSATIWADYQSIVEASAAKAPTSVRAQAQHATNLYNAGRYDDAIRTIDRAIENIPGDSSRLIFSRLIMLCEMNVLSDDEFAAATTVLSNQIYDGRQLSVYTAFAEAITSQKCPNISADKLRGLFSAILAHPQNSDPKSLGYSQIRYFIGFAYLYAGEPTEAVKAFEESLQARPGASHAMLMAALLATNEYFDEALELSDRALSQLDAGADPMELDSKQRVRESDIREFQKTVRSERESKKEDGTARPIP